MNGKRVGLDLRVSTEEQTVENQPQVLIEVIERRGWRIIGSLSTTASAAPKGATNVRAMTRC
jgi:DNA invertase Pin-like site-specific DNA recombinase